MGAHEASAGRKIGGGNHTDYGAAPPPSFIPEQKARSAWQADHATPPSFMPWQKGFMKPVCRLFRLVPFLLADAFAPFLTFLLKIARPMLPGQGFTASWFLRNFKL